MYLLSMNCANTSSNKCWEIKSKIVNAFVSFWKPHFGCFIPQYQEKSHPLPLATKGFKKKQIEMSLFTKIKPVLGCPTRSNTNGTDTEYG